MRHRQEDRMAKPSGHGADVITILSTMKGCAETRGSTAKK
jgi:hypothetical protein